MPEASSLDGKGGAGLNLIMKIARSRCMAGVVSLALRRFLVLLPVKVLAKSADAVMIVHPKPSYDVHYLVVPKKRIKDITKLVEKEEVYRKVAEFICENVDPKGKMLVCNFGERQEVKQVHFHIISGDFAEEGATGTDLRNQPFAKVDSNYYIRFDLLKNRMVTKRVIEQALRESPKGFTVLWY